MVPHETVPFVLQSPKIYFTGEPELARQSLGRWYSRPWIVLGLLGVLLWTTFQTNHRQVADYLQLVGKVQRATAVLSTPPPSFSGTQVPRMVDTVLRGGRVTPLQQDAGISKFDSGVQAPLEAKKSSEQDWLPAARSPLHGLKAQDVADTTSFTERPLKNIALMMSVALVVGLWFRSRLARAPIPDTADLESGNYRLAMMASEGKVVKEGTTAEQAHGIATSIVLFQPGDLRVHDHLGLQAALRRGKPIIPLVILDPSLLMALPGGPATLRLVHDAITDLSRQLDKLGASLVVRHGDTAAIIRDLAQKGLGSPGTILYQHEVSPPDGLIGYVAPVPLHVPGIKVETWNSHLRQSAWAELGSIPTQFPAYKSQIMVRSQAAQPIPGPESIPSLDTDVVDVVGAGDGIRSVDGLLQETWAEEYQDMVLESQGVTAQGQSGLYATHWGLEGTDNPSRPTCTESEALDLVGKYVAMGEAGFVKNVWIGPQGDALRDPLSLEHAAMVRMCGSGNFPSGLNPKEAIARALAAPLFLGCISPRQLWHTRQDLRDLVENREWHALLAARVPSSDSEYGVEFRHWRWHGFLCRYAMNEKSFGGGQDATGPPLAVVLVHGFGASGWQWKGFMSALSSKMEDLGTRPIRCFALDLLGFGQSEKPSITYTQYLWENQVRDFIDEVVRPIHGGNFIIAGNSIGGYTSIGVAGDAAITGQKCEGLVLMNSAGKVLTPEEASEYEAEYSKSVEDRTIEGLLDPLSAPPRPVAQVFANGLIWGLRPRIASLTKWLYPSNPEKADEALKEDISRASLDPGAWYVMASGAKLPPPRTINDLLGAYGKPGKFQGPVLVAQGMLDPLNDAPTRAKKISGLREGIDVAPIQAGHCPHDEAPEEVAQAMANWLVTTGIASGAGCPVPPSGRERMAMASIETRMGMMPMDGNPSMDSLPFRVGHGWDLHRLEPGYKLILGGIDIPHTVGCVAHSDGDVLLHTVTDAILGALCLPDIGQIFPDTDPKWKGASSDVFMREAVRLMMDRGYVLGNIDCTIIAEKPKLSPHKEKIRDALCEMLQADPSVVNIKAKTHEKVDSLGENRSIACHAVAMLIKPGLMTMGATSSNEDDQTRIAAMAISTEPARLPFRVGHGWDLHRLEPGYKLIIGGIEIPHTVGCVAHSDGDVLFHTVVDAILGALCLPDIGQIFPDNDPKWKGASSDVFMREAVKLMKERGYTLGNIDCTIIAEKPKLSPHKEKIRDNLCSLLEADPSVVNIKAKTHEKVDSLGENRSIACHAVVTLIAQD